MTEMNGDPLACLRELAQDNPAMGAVLQILERSRAAAAEAPAPSGDRLPRLENLVRRMYHDLKNAEDRLSMLAAALGACGLCWGEDPACAGCRGRGRPGMLSPDPELRQRLFAQPAAGDDGATR